MPYQFTASIDYLRQYNGNLHLGVKLKNPGQKEATANQAIQFSRIVVADVKAGKKYSPLKGADGRYLVGPVSDWNDGGRWFPSIPPESEILLWVLFDAVPPSAALTVQVPLMFSFEGVTVSDQAATVKEIVIKKAEP